MSALLTPNAQAILLLTAPLWTARSASSLEPLTLTEYNRLVRILRQKQKEPADLIGADAGQTIELAAAVFGRARVESLLGRGFLLSQAVDHWSARAIWVVSRADHGYPRRIKARLREDAPPALYGCGDVGLLDSGGLAIVGSRHVNEELIRYTENVGRLAAEARQAVVSGGAKGIDRAAMNGALQASGVVLGVMADSLERAALARENREPLTDHKLALISPYDPAAGFNVGHAMQRNKIIYALADAALVVTREPAAAYNAGSKIQPSEPVISAPETRDAAVGLAASEELLRTVREILRRELVEERTETEVAALLGVAKVQANHWLTRLADEGSLEKVTKPKPLRYRAASSSDRLL